jgi:Tyrosine phosphatase family
VLELSLGQKIPKTVAPDFDRYDSNTGAHTLHMMLRGSCAARAVLSNAAKQSAHTCVWHQNVKHSTFYLAKGPCPVLYQRQHSTAAADAVEAATAPPTPLHSSAGTVGSPATSSEADTIGILDGSAFDKVKNFRDAATVQGSGIKPGRLYRTGFLSDATPTDVDLLLNRARLRTLIDLRSPTEIGM